MKRERELSFVDIIVSQTDLKGNIIYANLNFYKFSGYERDSLIGKSYNITKDSDMPKAIFYLMWEHISQGRNIMAVVKNMAKNGNYYWVTTDFDMKRDKLGNINYFVAYRQATPKHVVEAIEKLYAKLLAIEEEHDMKASITYLEAYLEEKKMNYDQFIEDLAKPKGFAAVLFDKMKKLF